ncbi:hypothetical protein [Agrobacterium tumefaciens]|uniref:hypothetical protein n=1 Tax=Agrobacterium tumefaciens TaxID=358 RepID=UPI00157317A4|nr:hypothetical protein [Agrobacterium tumefaciens]WCJ63502.1 hypothetical protein G6M15_04705 [Agrobacterium tumefaciens]
MAAKSKKKTDMVPPALPVFSELEATLERLSRELDAISHSQGAVRVVSPTGGRRTPGRYKGVLVVGPEFFEPLTENELKEFVPE